MGSSMMTAAASGDDDDVGVEEVATAERAPRNRVKPQTNGKAAPAPAHVEIPALRINTIKVRLIGDSPLICHAWSEKAKRQILDKQMKRAKQAKAAKDPVEDYAESLYWLSKRPKALTEKSIASGKFGMPSVAFKSAAVDACSHVSDLTKVEARGAFHVVGEMVEIQGKPAMREDMVRIGMGVADIRYRGEFKEWSVELTIRFNPNVLSAEQITNLFNVAGFAIGVGEWRPQRDGSFGMWHVEAR